MQIYTESDVDVGALAGAQVTVLGYGSQGRAHALNLRDSGFNVTVGLRRGGKSWARAEQDGLAVKEPAAAVKGADLVCMLVPDLALINSSIIVAGFAACLLAMRSAPTGTGGDRQGDGG